MKRVAVLSMKGGTGRTTVAANLAAVLAADPRGRRVLAVGFDPRDQLALHFGGGLADPTRGLVAAILDGRTALRASPRRGAGRPAVLPFGTVSDVDRAALERRLATEPELLAGTLGRIFAAFDLAVLDVAAGPSPYQRHALENCDCALWVLQPDAASLATLPLLEAELRSATLPRGFAGSFLLLNRADESRRLARDVRASVGALSALGHRLAPVVIHADEALAESFALQRPVTEAAPSSQAATDVRQLGEWLAERLAGKPADIGAPRVAQGSAS